MFLGLQVDDAISHYYRQIPDHGERLSLDQVKDVYWEGKNPPPRASASSSGSRGRTKLREDRAVKLGLDALELSFRQLIPHLGEPAAVQRKVEYTVAPAAAPRSARSTRTSCESYTSGSLVRTR